MMKRVAPVVRAVQAQVRSAATHAQPVVNKGPSEEILKLQDKAKGPWSQLSVDEKTKLYRAAFGQSRRELQNPPSDSMQVILGSLAVIGVSCVAFFGINSLADPVPHTVNNKSWDQKSAERKVEQKMNPGFATK